ncbi:MAG: plasmid stability protein [Brachybacterium faecium]|nr:MAG: plasmid stability protein [Brachybacterium faecium]
MAAITIRNLSDETHRALKIRAAEHSRSTEAEVRAILDEAVSRGDLPGLGTLLHDAAVSSRAVDADSDDEFEIHRDRVPHEALDLT